MNDLNRIKTLMYEILLKDSTFNRPDIYKTLSVRSASVIKIVNDLKKLGVLFEPGQGGAFSGRKATPIFLNPNFMKLVGIDLRPELITGVLCDYDGTILHKCSIKPDGNLDVEISLSLISDIIHNLCEQVNIKPNELGGIAFADPGLVDPEKGISLGAANIKGWKDIKIREWLKDTFKCKHTLLYSGQMASAFYESMSHKERYGKSLFLLELGVGVGGAFIKNGTIFCGDNHSGMEIGHIVIEPNGPICKCGNSGCLEAIVSTLGIERKMQELVDNGVTSPIDMDNFSIENFVQSVKNNDKVTSTLAYDVSEKIGDSLVSVVAILNPSIIILRGALTGMGELLLSTVKRRIALKCLPNSIKSLEVYIASGGEYDAATGAMHLLKNKILKDIISDI
jgi:predicted NBD/HSP70 family sugar kinase